jgi:hypothetical protein
MDGLASRNGVKIITRQVGEEEQAGEIYELPIECKDLEGTLQGLVRFLFDLQNEDAMLDIRQFYVKPKGKGDVLLRGRFTLYCAYTRAGEGQR